MNFPIEIQSEFDYIVRAFQFVAMMFNASSGYMGLIATLGSLGIFFGGMSAITAQAISGKSAIQGWFMNMLVASVIVVLLLGNKSTVIVHDTVSNQMRSIGGIPTVMATLAYMENRMELGVKDIISNVMSPIIPYEDIGKGEGFELLASLDKAAKAYITKFPYIMRSMEAYFEDCGLKDLSRGWISEDAIYKSSDMWADLKSETQTNYTVVYDTAQGTTYTCKVAWDKINDMMAVAQIQSAVKYQCREKYKDDAAVQKCLQNQDDIVMGFLAGKNFTSIDLNSVIRSYLVSYAMHSSNGTLGVMLNDVNKKNAANAFMAEKMLPRLKGMMYGMMIGIFPLLVGFVWFNPAKTIVFYAGMFVMMILWSAIDTFMDMQYQNEVYQMFATMRDMGLGVNQMFDIPNKAADAVSLYGSGRWMAMGLATAIAGAITGVNSYAISQMGSQLGASAQSAAGSAAGYMDSAGKTNLDRQASSDFGSRELGNMMSVPNWNAQGMGQAMETKAAATKNAKLTEQNSWETVANQQGIAGAVNTQESISSAQAKMDYFGGNLPKVGDLAYGNSMMSTSSGKAYLDKMSALNGGDLKSTGENLGGNRGISDSAGMAEMNAKVKAIGENGIINNAANKGKYDAGKETAFFKELEKRPENLTTAGANAGQLDARNSLLSLASMQGRIYGSENFGNLLTDTKSLSKSNHQSDLGNMDAVKTQADLMNMDVDEYSEFMRNGNVLDEKTANHLNNQMGTEVFRSGQQFRFSVGEKGFTEMSLTDNVNNKQLGSYTLNGTQSSILNDDGTVASTRYEGVFDKDGRTFAGGITTDSNDSIVTASGNTGSELYDKLIYTNTTQLDDQYDVMQSILSGDKRVFERLNGLTGEEQEGAYRQLAGSLAGELAAFRQDNENQSWGTGANASIGVGAHVDINTKDNIIGKIGTLATGASAGGSVKVDVGLGIKRDDNSYSQQNTNASDIYEILQNANNDTDVMLKNTQAYLNNKIGENLSGMDTVAETVSNAADTVQSMGFGYKGVIGKDEDGNIMSEQFERENGKWNKK